MRISKEQFAKKTHDLAVDGHKVMDVLDLSPGPEVGGILEELMELVTEDPDLNNKEALIAQLKEIKSREGG